MGIVSTTFARREPVEEVDLGLEGPAVRKWLDKFQQVGLDLISASSEGLEQPYERVNDIMRSIFALPVSYFPLFRVFASPCRQLSKTPLDDLRFSKWSNDELFFWKQIQRILASMNDDVNDRKPIHISGVEGHTLARALSVFHAVSVIDEVDQVERHFLPELPGAMYIVQNADESRYGSIVIADSLDKAPPLWWHLHTKAVVIVDKI